MIGQHCDCHVTRLGPVLLLSSVDITFRDHHEDRQQPGEGEGSCQPGDRVARALTPVPLGIELSLKS